MKVFVNLAFAPPPLFGLSADNLWSKLLSWRGLERVDEEQASVVVDARFLCLSRRDWRALEDGAPLHTRDGQEVAAPAAATASPRIVSGRAEVRLDPECPTEVFDRVERHVRQLYAQHLGRAGVRFIDPRRVIIDPTVHIAAGARIWPDVVLIGHTTLEPGCEVRPGCWIEDCALEADVTILPHSVCVGARIGAGSAVGPMAHLRPGADLAGDNRVGNFVEVKQTRLEPGAKASHLTYLGDAWVGPGANVGAGTITCNYDGYQKHRTRIGAGAFIGSNTALIAPVEIGDGAIVGAGSVISRSVPDEALAIERAEQRTIEGGGRKLNDRNRRAAQRAKREREP